MRIVKCEQCGYLNNPNAGGGGCPMYGGVKMDFFQRQGANFRPVVDHATAFKKKSYSNYYCKCHICEKCGGYALGNDVCPACGKKEMKRVTGLAVSKDRMDESFNMKILPNMDNQDRITIIEIDYCEKKKEIEVCQSGFSVFHIRSFRDIQTYKNQKANRMRKSRKLTCALLTIFVLFSFFANSEAQNVMRVNYKDGSVYDVPIERIDSITFIEKKAEQQNATLVGEWFWGNKEKGYYEVMAFNEDRTYIGYDYYLEYGFDTWTYGTYMANGIMLNLWSNGFGYRRTYRWFMTGLTENALEVMNQMGSFIYYRIQSEIYSLKVGKELYACKDRDYYIFTDGVKVSENNGKLKGISEGTTYILKYNAEPGLIMAYKVIVEK